MDDVVDDDKRHERQQHDNAGLLQTQLDLQRDFPPEYRLVDQERKMPAVQRGEGEISI